jgi:hypothetical protein
MGRKRLVVLLILINSACGGQNPNYLP